MEKKSAIMLEALIDLYCKEAVLEYMRPHKDAEIERNRIRRRRERERREIKKDVLIAATAGIALIIAAYVVTVWAVSVIIF